MRVGFGYDVHRLVKGRDLILGGVNIPFVKGLAGHSDADVLTHALMDSLLGAAGKGDIGCHFPPSDLQFKDISSLLLLEDVRLIIEEAGWQIGNLDSVIVAQAPKVSKYIQQMKNNICRVLNVKGDVINIKATTTEGLGFTGCGDGIAAYATALLVAK